MSAVCTCWRVGVLVAAFGSVIGVRAEPIHVVQTQGVSRGFLVVRSESGKVLGRGDFVQTAHGARITSRLILSFLDGSVDDDTTVYRQGENFVFVSDHHVQKGPFFSKPTDYTVEANGQVTSRSVDKDGKEKVEASHIDLPADVSNGMIGTLLLNVAKDTPTVHLSMVAGTGKGRLVQLEVMPDGEARFDLAGMRHTANVFRIKIKLGGVTGVVAPVLGKAPADVLVWVLEGEAPALIREVGQLEAGGPIVSIEVVGCHVLQSTPRSPKASGK
jgi:hypothetical protein